MRRETNQHERKKKKFGHAVQISLGPDNWNQHNQQKTKKGGKANAHKQTNKKKKKTYDLAEHFLVR